MSDLVERLEAIAMTYHGRSLMPGRAAMFEAAAELARLSGELIKATEACAYNLRVVAAQSADITDLRAQIAAKDARIKELEECNRVQPSQKAMAELREHLEAIEAMDSDPLLATAIRTLIKNNDKYRTASRALEPRQKGEV